MKRGYDPNASAYNGAARPAQSGAPQMYGQQAQTQAGAYAQPQYSGAYQQAPPLPPGPPPSQPPGKLAYGLPAGQLSASASSAGASGAAGAATAVDPYANYGYVRCWKRRARLSVGRVRSIRAIRSRRPLRRRNTDTKCVCE